MSLNVQKNYLEETGNTASCVNSAVEALVPKKSKFSDVFKHFRAIFKFNRLCFPD